jgi:hypothetical protein
MSRLAILLLAAVAAFARPDGAPDPWSKVKELKSGTEIRILKKSSMQPVLGKFDEANDENLIIVVKNQQVAIPKDQIDRLDYRPPSGSRVVKETKTKAEDPSAEPRAGMNGSGVGPGSSTSTSVSIGSKPDFETLYRRPSPAPKKQ